MDHAFSNDPSCRKGFIYDWNIEPLEEVEFRFEQVKQRTPEKKAPEYFVLFKSDFIPECRYRDRYFKRDGKQRLGFYLDIPNYETGLTEKWFVVGKDERVNFSRYIVFKCNWCLEWISDGIYHQHIGVWRDSQDNNMNNPEAQKLGGSELDGDGSFMLPSNLTTRTLKPGQRLMITDSDILPAVYEIQAIKDTEPLGCMKMYLKRRVVNEHTDAWGTLNEIDSRSLIIPTPIPDLPEGYGGSWHYLCDCKKSNFLSELVPEVSKTEVEVLKSSDVMVVNGSPVRFTVTPEGTNFSIYVDNEVYTIEELNGYFEVSQEGTSINIKAINPIMAGYIVKLSVMDANNVVHSAEVEVKL